MTMAHREYTHTPNITQNEWERNACTHTSTNTHKRVIRFDKWKPIKLPILIYWLVHMLIQWSVIMIITRIDYQNTRPMIVHAAHIMARTDDAIETKAIKRTEEQKPSNTFLLLLFFFCCLQITTVSLTHVINGWVEPKDMDGTICFLGQLQIRTFRGGKIVFHIRSLRGK